jgi:hypothetical protein
MMMPGLERVHLTFIAQDANPDGLSFPHISPEWSCIVLGQKVVEEVGLYDERLYPLYFDDNDYQRRIEKAGLPITKDRCNSPPRKQLNTKIWL